MKNITLKQLRYFDALCRHRHFGRAAEVCAISQPALSMQIKELETAAGQPLIERHARDIRPTRFGADFAERAREILRAVDELGELARAAQDALSGDLRLGVIPTVAPYLLPRIVPALRQLLPDMTLQIRETLTPRLMQELAEGQIDTAIVALPVSEPDFTEMPLFEETFLLVRPAADRGLPVPSPRGLRELQLLLLEEGHCFRDQALSFCNLRPGQPSGTLDGSSLSTLVQMVGAGLGVTLLPEMAVSVETRAAEVAIDRFERPEPSRTIGMIWRRNTPLEPQFKRIAVCLESLAQDAQKTVLA